METSGIGLREFEANLFYCIKFMMIMEILFRGVMVRAVLLTVAAADMIGQVFIVFSIDIPGELPFSSTGWTGVAGGRGFVGLEGEGHGGWGISDVGFRNADWGCWISEWGLGMLDFGCWMWECGFGID